MNTYGYVGGNPVNAIDPTGEFAIVAVLPWIAGGGSSGLLSGLSWGALIGTTAWGMSNIEAPSDASTQTANPSQCNNNDDDECEKLKAQIREHVKGMQKKYNDLATDPKDLYNKAYNTNPGGALKGYGTWTGHTSRYEGLRSGLGRMIRKAQSKGCDVPVEAYVWHHKSSPILPHM